VTFFKRLLKQQPTDEPEYKLIIESVPPGYTSAYMWSLYAPDGKCVVKHNFAETKLGCRAGARRAKRQHMEKGIRFVESI
jgi:hypothetical protein